jgi:hypothetical protein
VDPETMAYIGQVEERYGELLAQLFGQGRRLYSTITVPITLSIEPAFVGQKSVLVTLRFPPRDDYPHEESPDDPLVDLFSGIPSAADGGAIEPFWELAFVLPSLDYALSLFGISVLQQVFQYELPHRALPVQPAKGDPESVPTSSADVVHITEYSTLRLDQFAQQLQRHYWLHPRAPWPQRAHPLHDQDQHEERS